MSATGAAGRMFGTDGVRGVANRELGPELAVRLGRAGGAALARGRHSPAVIIGRDTRLSGMMLADALSAGLMSAGVEVHDAGICPTPGIAFLARAREYAGGAVVSASHNPYADNGIKFFGPGGTKLADVQEDEIEAALHATSDSLPRPEGVAIGRRVPQSDLVDAYAAHVISTARHRYDGLHVVLDCANGATAGLAGKVFAGLGARVELLAAAPDGVNINAGVGSTHPQAVAGRVCELGADLGFAFDGDGDRVIAVDSTGRIVDGDALMAICALDMLRRDALPGRTLVATVMSNLGLDEALAAAGGRVQRTAVGDRHVAQAMRDGGLALGGEQSGHIIFSAHNTTGDGMITAVQVLDILAGRGISLDQAAAAFTWYPQAQRSVRFGDRAAARLAAGAVATGEALAAAEVALGARGRVVLRASGTEPLVRILVEAKTEQLAGETADRLAEVVAQAGKVG